MKLWDKFIAYVKARLFFKPTEFKNGPGIHDPAAFADHANVLIGSAIDAASGAGHAAVENALHVHPDTLKGAPGVTDHVLAADLINGLIQTKL